MESDLNNETYNEIFSRERKRERLWQNSLAWNTIPRVNAAKQQKPQFFSHRSRFSIPESGHIPFVSPFLV